MHPTHCLIYAQVNTTQTQTFARALELAAAEASSREDQSIDAPRDALAFEHIFILRLDMALTRSNLTCLFSQDGPMTHRTNTDQLTYLPGRYFACALRVRHALVFGHKWVAEILSLSGVNRPSGPLLYSASPVGTRVEIKIYGAFVLNHRVVLRAIDATPARWRDDAGSLPLDGASTAASSPRNDLVHPKHWLISTQAASCGGTTGRRRSRTSATRCGPCSTRPRRRCPSGTSVFGVVFVFDLWRGVDGATRREAHGVGTRRRSVAALAFERRRHRRDSPFALHRSRTCTSASSGYRSRTPRATGAPPSRSTSRSRRPRRS